MVAEETKKETKKKARPKAPEVSGIDEGAEGELLPLAEALGGDEPPSAGGTVAAAGGEEGDWEPSMEWLMGSLGPFFNNNQGIGELLLDKLKDSGVNTEGVALAGLVNVLQQFSKEYKALSEAVGDNLDRINELSAENQDLSAKLQEIVREMGMTEEDGGQPPDIGADIGGDLGGDMGAPPGGDMGAPPGGDMGGGMPPDMGAPPGGDMGGGMPPDMGAPPGGDMGGGMPPDMGAPPGGDIMSDERMKQKVISDRRMKRLVQEAGRRAKRGTRISRGIIGACVEGVE